jgi:esterase/lipase superfamily enzyme
VLMRAALRRLLCAVLLASGLAGCSARPGSGVLTPVAQVPRYTDKVDILVATTRGRDDAEDPDAFTATRSKSLNYSALTVSIPKGHVAGKIEWPDTGPPDPAVNFMTTDRSVLTGSEFVSSIRNRVRQSGPEAKSVLVFVHGYNTLYQESVYRFAQFIYDSGFKGTAVLFAWPSRGKAPLYLADRESTNYSRDYLEQALLQIASVPDVQHIDILAHSMGNWLAVETLRQAKMKRHGDFGGKLHDVVLASPDIDINVFRTQLDVIGPLRQPMTILVSGDDKVLSLSSALAGGVERVGVVAVDDPRVIAGAHRYNLRVVDLSKVPSGGNLNHDKFAESEAVLSAIGSGLAKDYGGKAQSGVFDAVISAGTTLLEVPAALAGAGQ